MNKKAKGAVPMIICAAEELRKAKGQAYSDPLMRALLKLERVLMDARSVIEAKDIYYSQIVDNEDALHVALTLWADRVDALERACDVAERDVP